MSRLFKVLIIIHHTVVWEGISNRWFKLANLQHCDKVKLKAKSFCYDLEHNLNFLALKKYKFCPTLHQRLPQRYKSFRNNPIRDLWMKWYVPNMESNKRLVQRCYKLFSWVWLDWIFELNLQICNTSVMKASLELLLNMVRKVTQREI